MPTPCTADLPRPLFDYSRDHFDEIAVTRDRTDYLISQRLRVDCSDKPLWFHPNNKAAQINPRARKVWTVSQFVPTAAGSPVGFLHFIADYPTKAEALACVYPS